MAYRSLKLSNSPFRTLFAMALVAVTVTVTAGPAAAAVEPWPFEGQSVYNQRYSGWDGPSSTRVSGGSMTQLWKRSVNGEVNGTPIVAIGGVFFGSTDGSVYATHQANGNLYWARFVGGPVYGSPIYVNHPTMGHTIYVLVSRLNYDSWNQGVDLVALNAVDGSIRWRTRIDDQNGAVAWGSPNYSARHDLIYAGTCDCRNEQAGTNSSIAGVIASIDATNGALIMRSRTSSAGGGGVVSTPLVIDQANVDRVYYTTTHSYSAPQGYTSSVFSVRAGAQAATAAELDPKRFQARADDNAANAAVSPTKKQGFPGSPLIVAGKYIGAGSKDGKFYALNPFDLTPVWSATVGVGSSHGGVIGSVSWDQSKVHGTSATPGVSWGLTSAGASSYILPSDDPTRYGPTSASNGVVWSTNTAGLLEGRDRSTGRPYIRLSLGAPSTAGVSVGGGRVYAAIGTTRGTGGGGVVAFR